jgi:hypothetical protein
LTSEAPAEFQTSESEEERVKTCSSLRSAFNSIEEAFGEINERISSSIDSPDASEQEIVEFAMAVSNIARIAKRVCQQRLAEGVWTLASHI